MFIIKDIIIEEEIPHIASKCDIFLMCSDSTYRSRLKKAATIIEDNWKHTVKEFVNIGRINGTNGPYKANGTDITTKPSVEPLNVYIGSNWYPVHLKRFNYYHNYCV